MRPGLATEEAIIETRPHVAKQNANVKVKKITPIQLAVQWNRIEVLKVLLEHDQSLGYEISAYGEPLLVSAAFGGHVGIAQEILNHCPDAPYTRQMVGHVFTKLYGPIRRNSLNSSCSHSNSVIDY